MVMKKTILATVAWYLFCSVTLLALVAYGNGTYSPHVYYHGEARDYWWHPTNVTLALLLTFLLPLPHVLGALCFRSKRNATSVLSIGKSWYRAVGLVVAAFMTAGMAASMLAKPGNNSDGLAPSDRSRQVQALKLAFSCGSLNKKLGRIEEATDINGYAISVVSGLFR